MSPELDLSKLPKWRRDYLEVFGNTYKPSAVLTGTCEACVWGTKFHQHQSDCQFRDREVMPTIPKHIGTQYSVGRGLTVIVKRAKVRGPRIKVDIL